MSYSDLSKEKLEAGKECLALLDEYGLGVQGALWIYVRSLNEWRFYVVTSLVKIDGLIETYDRIERLFGLRFRDSNLMMEDIHLASPDEPLFQAMAGMIRAENAIVELQRCNLNGVELEHAYVYRLTKAPPEIKAKQARQKFDQKVKQIERESVSVA
jgi:hypothetical protein